MNVEQFAQELKLPPQLLLEQLKAAGVSKQDVVDAVTEADKAHLLDYLRKMHGGAGETGKTKITITRKQTGEIRKTDSTGKSRTITVETRKSRTYVKRDPAALAAEAPAELAPVVAEAPVVVEAVPVAEPVAPVVVEPVAVIPEVVEAPPVAEIAAPVEAVAADAAPVVKKTTRIKKATILNEAEVKAREEETRRHQALQERQAADSRARAEREALRKQAEAAREAAKLAEAQKANAPAAPVAPTEKTLHKPDKPGAAKPTRNPPKKRITGKMMQRGDAAASRPGAAQPPIPVGAAARTNPARVTKTPISSSRLKQSCAKSWCPRPLPWPSWRTSCQSRRPKSSRP